MSIEEKLTDKQQVEELAKTIGRELGIAYEGERLPFSIHTRDCLAKALYNAGYRKVLHRIDDKSQVIYGETFVPYKDAKMFINKAKEQAVKEFVEKFKEKLEENIAFEDYNIEDWEFDGVTILEAIDETLKEVIGDKKL